MNSLILGINGYVVAVDKATGDELWRTKLKSSSITVVSSDERQVYAAASGYLYCLNKQTGEKLWVNELKGLGFNTCIIDVGSAVGASAMSNSAVISSAATSAAFVAASGSASGGDGA